METKNQSKEQKVKIAAKNKSAYFEYFVEEKFECGIVLCGSEVKSIRLGHSNLADSFCFFEHGELFLKNYHITPYEKGSFFNTEARRDRKLLMHKHQISRLFGKVREKGYTLIPLCVYFRGGIVKVEIGLCKGKQQHDKRDSIRERDLNRDAQRQIKEYR